VLAKGANFGAYVLAKGANFGAYVLAKGANFGAHVLAKGTNLGAHVLAKGVEPLVGFLMVLVHRLAQGIDGEGKVTEPLVNLFIGPLEPAETLFRRHDYLAQS